MFDDTETVPGILSAFNRGSSRMSQYVLERLSENRCLPVA